MNFIISELNILLLFIITLPAFTSPIFIIYFYYYSVFYSFFIYFSFEAIFISIAFLFFFRRRNNPTDSKAETARSFSILVKGISDCALYMLTPEGHVANWNAGAQRLKGYTQQEILGQPLRIFYTEADRRSGLPVRALETARITGKYTGEGWRCRKDGTAFWAHVTIERILDSKDRLIGFAKITRDMSRLKEEQDHLAQIRGQLDAALDNMHQGLVLFDAQAHVLLCNRRLPVLWSLEADNISAGVSLTNLTERLLESRHVTDREAIRSELLHALSPTSYTSRIITCAETFVIAIASRPLPESLIRKFFNPDNVLRSVA